MSEDDFYTELDAGAEIPIRRLNENYIVGYDYFPPEEFLHFVNLLLNDEGEYDIEYSSEDVSWTSIIEIDFDEPTRIVFSNGYSDEDSTPVTVLECW